MDHVPLPKGCSARTRRVPLVGLPYDANEDFLTYPLRAGNPWQAFVPLEAERLIIPYESAGAFDEQALQSFLQTWLFFGLIQELFRPCPGLYHASEYQSSDRHGQYVHTRHFGDRLRQWAKAVRQKSASKKAVIADRLANCCHMAWETMQAIFLPRDHQAARYPTFDEGIRESILMLCATISTARMQNLDKVGLETLVASTIVSKGFSVADKWKMLRNGWCPSVIASEDAALNTVTFHHFIKNMEITDPRLDHRACDEEHCCFEAIDPQTYTAAHVENECRCSSLEVSMIDIKQCLEAGIFPVLDIHGTTKDEMSLQVVPWQSGRQYVALSHVWADGLGNPKGNGLPRCQLLALRNRLYALTANPSLWSTKRSRILPETKLYLWCDTLLVPVPQRLHLPLHLGPSRCDEASHLETLCRLRKIAMNMMERVYSWATFVLVLEATLEHVSVESVGWLEAYVRFLCSRYTRRLWTLQEASLPAKVLIQFEDQVMDLQTLRARAEDLCENDAVFCDLTLNLTFRPASLQPLQGLKGRDQPSLDAVYDAIRDRKCSFAADEPQCLSTMLKLDRSRIVNTEGRDHGMREVWNAIAIRWQGIPQDIIFNQLPRLSSYTGYHWAPCTLRQARRTGNFRFCRSSGEPRGCLVEDVGLRVKYPGYRIRLKEGVHNRQYRQSINIKLPIGSRERWYMLCNSNSTLSRLEAGPLMLLAERPEADWHIVLEEQLTKNERYGTTALLGEMVIRDSQPIFESRLVIEVALVSSSESTVRDAVEDYANRIWKDCVESGRSVTEAVEQLDRAGGFRLFSPDVEEALAADPTTRNKPHSVAMKHEVMDRVTGHDVIMEEVFDAKHKWIIG